MSKLIFCLILLIQFSIEIFAQWMPFQNGLPSSWISGWAVGTVNDQIGFASVYVQGQSPLYKTTNGGLNWSALNIPQISFGAITDIAAQSNENIWVGSFDGKIIYSSDGGNNWVTQFEDNLIQPEFCYIEFFDNNNGIALGNTYSGSTDCLILKTTDGGNDWSYVVNDNFGGYSGDKWNRIDFVNPLTGYFFPSGKIPKSIYKTTDGGINWNSTNYSGSDINAIKFYSEEYGIANSGNKIYQTDDGGLNWAEAGLDNVRGWGMDIEFVPNNPQIVYITEMYKLFFSADSGKTWSVVFEIPEGSQEFIRDIEFNDIDNGWMVCDKGKFYRITNASEIVSVSELPDNVLRNYILEQNYPNPFNPSTMISYSISKPDFVSLKVYDILGNEIQTLVNQYQSANVYSVNFNADGLSSGVYFYCFKTGSDNLSIKKMMLLR